MSYVSSYTGAQIDSAVGKALQGYESVTIDGTAITTMGQLRTEVNSINTAGRHVLFDLHAYSTDAYSCLIHMHSSGDVNYCEIYDLLNGRVYGQPDGYTDATPVSTYVQNEIYDQSTVYTSVAVENLNTMGEVAAYINGINADGKHALFDFHTYIPDAYVCTVHMFTQGNVKYCYIYDLVNEKAFVNYAGYNDSDTISAFIANNKHDIVHTIAVTNNATTLGTINTMLTAVNALGDHVLFDVSSLETNCYLLTIFIDGVNYKIFDLVSQRTNSGAYDASTTLVSVLQAATTYTIATGSYDAMTVGTAKNLQATDNLVVTSQFATRTTAGGGSIVDASSAQLDYVDGNCTIPVHTDMVFSPFIHEATRVTCAVDETTFVSLIHNSGTYYFRCLSETSWEFLNEGIKVVISHYGVTLTGTPKAGDLLQIDYDQTLAVGGRVKSVVYTAVNRVNYTFNSATFASNSYVTTKGDGTYSFIYNGASWSLVFESEEPQLVTLADYGISLESGESIDSDNIQITYSTQKLGTIVVSTPANFYSGNADGSLSSTIAIPTADASSQSLPTATYGLPGFYNTRDRIDYSAKKYIKNVDRMAYSAANLATVKSYGTEYIYDGTWIYYGLTTPVTYTLSSSISNTFTAYSNGVEKFTISDGTTSTVGVGCKVIYGQNLVKKISADTLTLSAQSLTSAQKTQVQSNLGFWCGTQSEYNALGSYDDNIYYFIKS